MAYPPSTWTTEEIQAENVGAGGIATPTITSRTPTSGAAAGGTVVTVVGTGFTRGTKVMVDGGTPFAPTGGFSPTELKFTTPAHAAGAVNVVVCAGPGSTATTFTYT
jgi:hypothetical protein